jgi:hypothetical protein
MMPLAKQKIFLEGILLKKTTDDLKPKFALFLMRFDQIQFQLHNKKYYFCFLFPL